MCKGPEAGVAWLVQETRFRNTLCGENAWYLVGPGNNEAVIIYSGQIAKGLE